MRCLLVNLCFTETVNIICLRNVESLWERLMERGVSRCSRKTRQQHGLGSIWCVQPAAHVRLWGFWKWTLLFWIGRCSLCKQWTQPPFLFLCCSLHSHFRLKKYLLRQTQYRFKMHLTHTLFASFWTRFVKK